MLDIIEVEKTIRAAVEKARAEGWTFAEGQVEIDRLRMRCCPLGALGIDDPTIEEFPDAALGAGLTVAQINGFWCGFDAAGRLTTDDQEAYELGQKFRRELL